MHVNSLQASLLSLTSPPHTDHSLVMLNTDKINATTALLTPSFLTYIVENEVFSAAVISLPVTHAYRVRDC